MNIKGILYFTLLVLGTSGCSKEFLEAEPQGSQISERTINRYNKEIPEVGAQLTEAIFNGLYAWMYTPGAGGTDEHSDFGQKSFDLRLDILSGDFVKILPGYGHFTQLQELKSTTDYTNLENYIPWRFYYRLIFTANRIIKTIGGNDAQPTTPETMSSFGQALAMRAFSYYYLTQLFASEYKPEADLCPLLTSVKDLDKPVATQAEIYEQIIKDFKRAIELLSEAEKKNKRRADKYQVNSDVAKAYLAYTFAAMGNYEEVEKLTQEIIMSKAYSPFTIKDILYPHYDKVDSTKEIYGPKTEKSGMGNSKLPGVMWGIAINPDMRINLRSFPGMINFFYYSYAAAGDGLHLSDAIKFHDGDLRKHQFVDGLPINKFYHKGRTKFGVREVEDDYIYLRYDEMILLDVEAKAMLNKDEEARKELKEYLKDRFEKPDNLSYLDNLSGEQLKDEVYLQIRTEFVGEGRSLMAARRFKKEITYGANRYDVHNRGKKINYNDPALSFKIPENERLNNINLYKKPTSEKQ